MNEPAHVKEVYKLLRKIYPDAITFLDYKTPFQLLVAVVLSAQTTDAQVNKITPVLFAKYPDPEALMAAQIPNVEGIIRSTGFYKVKTRNIIGAAKKIVSDYNSEVPQQMEDLLTLPGVGRKSANVIRAHCFNKPSIIVDTHFSRVTKRIGLTSSSNPEGIERDLLLITDKAIQTEFSMIINTHGRKICMARNPLCGECVLNNICSHSG